jgi:sigma-70-like protein
MDRGGLPRSESGTFGQIRPEGRGGLTSRSGIGRNGFHEQRLGFAHGQRRSYRGIDNAATWIRTMKGRRQGNWDPDLSLAILAATQYPPHTQQVIANYMGVSRQRVEQIEKKALRKVRIQLMRQPQVWEA